MNLSAQKIHSETIPDKQADKALMPENLSSLTLMLISLFWIAIIFIPVSYTHLTLPTILRV